MPFNSFRSISALFRWNPWFPKFTVTASEQPQETSADAEFEAANLARSRAIRKQRILITGFIIVPVLLLIAVLFLYPKQVIQLTVIPEEIADEAFKNETSGSFFNFGESILLYSNQATVEIGHEGYKSVSVELLASGGPTEYLIELIPEPGYLDIFLLGELPVEVLVDEKRVGALKGIELEAGTHSITLRYQGVFLTDRTIEVAGFGERLYEEFDLSMYESSVKLMVEPRSAQITIDDESPVTGFLDMAVPIGDHQIKINHPHYSAAEIRLTTKVGDYVDLETVRLKPKPIKVTITSEPQSASILVDSKFVGESDLDFDLLPNRSYEIRAFKPGFGERTLRVNPRIGEVITKHFDFVQDKITVNVDIEPQGTVFVDGIERGQAPQTVSVYAGDLIEARSPGLVTKSFEVDLAQGQTQSIHFQLFEPLEHAYRQAPQKITIQGELELTKFPALEFTHLVSEDPIKQSEVSLSRPFYLGVTEVTVKAFKQFKQGSQGGDNEPITRVSWLDAIKFCNWLSQENNLEPVYALRPSGLLATVNEQALGYRLPTEMEWETGISYDWRNKRVLQPFEWGSNRDIPIAFANLAGRERAKVSRDYMEEHGDNHERLAPVKSYAPNQNGLYDMTGNVSEWVHDHFDARREVNLPPSHFDKRNGITRTIKGGNYTTDELADLTIYARDFEESSRPTLGFRIARWIH